MEGEKMTLRDDTQVKILGGASTRTVLFCFCRSKIGLGPQHPCAPTKISSLFSVSRTYCVKRKHRGREEKGKKGSTKCPNYMHASCGNYSNEISVQHRLITLVFPDYARRAIIK